MVVKKPSLNDTKQKRFWKILERPSFLCNLKFTRVTPQFAPPPLSNLSHIPNVFSPSLGFGEDVHVHICETTSSYSPWLCSSYRVAWSRGWRTSGRSCQGWRRRCRMKWPWASHREHKKRIQEEYQCLRNLCLALKAESFCDLQDLLYFMVLSKCLYKVILFFFI